MKNQLTRPQVYAAIIGHATADALGVPVEFTSREARRLDPVTDMRGYGTYGLPAGTWSDDTSMTLAALDSLTYGFDPEDMMARFDNWLTNAAYTATDDVFDIGNTTYHAISCYRRGVAALDCGDSENTHNGNGSLMRCIPTALYVYSRMPDAPMEAVLEIIHQSSAITHAHMLSKLCCGIYSYIIWALLKEPDKVSVRRGLEEARKQYSAMSEFAPALRTCSRIFDPDFVDLPEDDIRSGGYVLHTLEAAVWCLMNTASYPEAVLRAVNLGSDTDTVAAVTGGLAGLMYGANAIPRQWLDTLIRRDVIEEMCNAFTDAQVAQ